jgi:hypothetical protein
MVEAAMRIPRDPGAVRRMLGCQVKHWNDFHKRKGSAH